MCSIGSKLTIKTPDRRLWTDIRHCSRVSNVDFEQVSATCDVCKLLDQLIIVWLVFDVIKYLDYYFGTWEPTDTDYTLWFI